MADPVTISLRAGPDVTKRLTELVVPVMEAIPDRSLVRTVELVLEELVTNIVRHAYGESGGPIDLELEAGEDEIRIVVSDEGSPFDPCTWESPAEVTGEGGRGLILVRCLTSEMHYERTPGGRNVTTCIVRCEHT
jgi:serine/threonine-protein kinase RsbW